MDAALPLLKQAAQRTSGEEVQILLEQIKLDTIPSKRCLHTFQGHSGRVNAVSLSADGRWALSGSDDKTVRLWEVATGQYLRTFHGHGEAVSSVSLSADGRLALSGGDRSMRLWEIATGRCLRVFMGGGVRVSLSADGRLALSGSGSGGPQFLRAVRIWDLATGHCLRTFEGHTGPVSSVSLSADSRLALSAGAYEDNTVRLWEVATGRCLHIFQRHTAAVNSVSLSADNHWILSGSSDHTIRLWEVATGCCLHIFQGHTAVNSVSLSADGPWVLSGSNDGIVQLWELDWELEARTSADWDEGALPTVKTFLTLHTPYATALPEDHEPSEQEIQQALTRHGKPTWTEHDFQDLIHQLQYAGYGWLRPEGVQRKLEEIAASWQGPPPLLSI